MPFLDWITQRNAPQAAPASQAPTQTPATPSVDNLPAHVKAAAVEAARPAAQLAGDGAVGKNAPVNPQATPNPRRGLALGR
jgi:hypothetical protein